MARASLVAAFGLELDHAELGAALVGDHARLHADPAEILAVDDIGAVDVEQRLELHGLAFARGQPLDQQGLAPLHAVLLSASFHDCVHSYSELEAAEADSALAPERRRPPLRPRRRGFDSRASSSLELVAGEESRPALGPASEPFGPPFASTSEATAEVRPASSIRTRRFSPTYGVPPWTEMM